MFLLKKKTSSTENVDQALEKKDYYPVVHVANSLRSYQKQLVNKEVDSLQELREVQLSFDKVLEDNNVLKEKLNSFNSIFETVGLESGKFDNVKKEIVSTGGGCPEKSAGTEDKLCGGTGSVSGNAEYFYRFSGFRKEDRGLYESDYFDCQSDQYAGSECFH